MSEIDMQSLRQEVRDASSFCHPLLSEIHNGVIGQQNMIERLLVGILADGHILLEGLPGLAKTTAVKAFADAMDLKFQRIQFTPDLLPADLLGTQIYNAAKSEFEIKKGPLFSHLVLADEINRAPSKVQSALLEAMGERQITLADTTFSLEQPFLVLATQNPLEQEGTYPLPEAQLDRFMLKVLIDYPSMEEEKQILQAVSGAGFAKINAVLEPKAILDAREVVKKIYMDARIQDYIINLVSATRTPAAFGLPDLSAIIEVGASPRASIDLAKASKAHAFIQGRAYVTPEDIKSIGMDVLRHRIALSYEAQAEEISVDQVVQKIFDSVEVP
jgi:MoxR-like ATPase